MRSAIQIASVEVHDLYEGWCQSLGQMVEVRCKRAPAKYGVVETKVFEVGGQFWAADFHLHDGLQTDYTTELYPVTLAQKTITKYVREGR